MKKALKISAVVVALVVLFAMAFVFTSSAAETTVGTVDELTAALASETETVVKLGTDLTIDATINVGGQITLDLNGHTITSASTGALFNQAGVAHPVEFKITDSVGGGAIIAADATLIGNNIGGTAKIEGGAIVVGTAVDSTNTKVTLTVAQSETYKTGTWTSFNPNQSTVLGFKGYATTEANYVATTVAGVNYYVSPEVYTIEYIVPNGATHTNVETFTIWDNVTFTDATAAGYDFDGWYNGEEEIEKIDAGTEYHSIVLTGKFTAKTYTITYEGLNGATHTNPADFKVTYANVKLTDATKTGYTFLGWYTEANGQGTRVTEIACSTTTENVTVYAHFEAITYTITYVTYGGTTTNTLVGTYTIEDTFNFETLSKDGYNWDAWYTYASSISGIDQSYDEQGNAITG